MSKKSKKPEFSPQQVIERFVIRARRVESHSLVQSGAVRRYAQPCETYSVSREGVTRTGSNIAEDEEAIESLAARLRPLILPSEPICLEKVFQAIHSSVDVEALGKQETNRLNTIEEWAVHRLGEKDSSLYTMWLIDNHGVPLTDPLSDETLAESWLYADLVHASPRGEKEQGLKLGFLRRYEAASAFFCEVAIEVVDLLNVLRSLAAANDLSLSAAAFNCPVTYQEVATAAAEKPMAGIMYFLPSEMDSSSALDPTKAPGAIRVTPAVLRGMVNVEAKASFEAFDAHGDLLGERPALFEEKDGHLTFYIDDALRISMTAKVEALKPGDSMDLDVEPLGEETDEAGRIAESMRCPNYADLRFEHEGRSAKLRIQLPEDALCL